MLGRHCTLEPLSAAQHAGALFDAYAENADDSNWTYLPYGPFDRLADFVVWVTPKEQSFDPVPFAIRSHHPYHTRNDAVACSAPFRTALA